MGVYVVSAIMLLFIIINYYLSIKLYREPNNVSYFNNVTNLNFSKNKYITPEPKYIVTVSILTGILFGMYLFLSIYFRMNTWAVVGIILILTICYLSEISRKIIIKDDKLILSKAFSKTIELYGRDIKGIYIYSYNKKFLKKHALTTKLVVVTKNDKKYKFILSSLNNKSVLNMLSDVFGVTDYKMFIANKNN